MESARGTIRGGKVKTFGMDFHLVPKRPQGNPAGRRRGGRSRSRTEEGGRALQFYTGGREERNKSQAEEARPLEKPILNFIYRDNSQVWEYILLTLS